MGRLAIDRWQQWTLGHVSLWQLQHPAHGQIHRNGARPVQGLLEVTCSVRPRPQSLSASNPSAVSSRLREVCLPGEKVPSATTPLRWLFLLCGDTAYRKTKDHEGNG